MSELTHSIPDKGCLCQPVNHMFLVMESSSPNRVAHSMNLKTLESFSMCWILLSTASVLYLVLGFISFRFHHPPQALSLLTIKFVFYYWTQHFHVLCAMKREKKNLKKSHSLCIQAKILWYDIWVHLRSSIPWKSPWSQHNIGNFEAALSSFPELNNLSCVFDKCLSTQGLPLLCADLLSRAHLGRECKGIAFFFLFSRGELDWFLCSQNI